MLTGIRTRMLAAALVPVGLVVVCLVAVFWTSRVSDLDESHGLRSQLMARQVAQASEYGLFSGNVVALQAVLAGVLREPDVKSVALFSVDGVLLVSSGALHYSGLDDAKSASYADRQRKQKTDVLVEVVVPANVPIDDLFTSLPEARGTPPKVLGYVVMEVSRAKLLARERDLLVLALAIGFAGLLLGGVLATRMGEGVVRPVLRISQMVERIGEGDLTVSAEVDPGDPLYGLQARLNQMAQRLAWGRDELEFRVESATQELRLKKEEAENAN
ncbi:MAG: HAMP domain-containing protein, partial [Rhodoferax sp.]